MPLSNFNVLWPQLEVVLHCRSILVGYTIYFENLVCHITLRKWFLHALPVLSGSYSFNCQILRASVNLPKHHLQEKERELWFVFTCTLAALLSHVRLTCLINITSLQRSNLKPLCDTTGFVLKQHNIHAGFCNNETAAVPQPWTLFCSCLFQILSQWEL